MPGKAKQSKRLRSFKTHRHHFGALSQSLQVESPVSGGLGAVVFQDEKPANVDAPYSLTNSPSLTNTPTEVTAPAVYVEQAPPINAPYTVNDRPYEILLTQTQLVFQPSVVVTPPVSTEGNVSVSETSPHNQTSFLTATTMTANETTLSRVSQTATSSSTATNTDSPTILPTTTSDDAVVDVDVTVVVSDSEESTDQPSTTPLSTKQTSAPQTPSQSSLPTTAVADVEVEVKGNPNNQHGLGDPTLTPTDTQPQVYSQRTPSPLLPPVPETKGLNFRDAGLIGVFSAFVLAVGALVIYKKVNRNQPQQTANEPAQPEAPLAQVIATRTHGATRGAIQPRNAGLFPTPRTVRRNTTSGSPFQSSLR